MGIELPPLAQLPRIGEGDKEQILGVNKAGSKPKSWSRNGVPLYWQESKLRTQSIELKTSYNKSKTCVWGESPHSQGLSSFGMLC